MLVKMHWGVVVGSRVIVTERLASSMTAFWSSLAVDAQHEARTRLELAHRHHPIRLA